MGEVEYNRAQLAKAWEWIKTNPRQFARLSLGRFEAFWWTTQQANQNDTIWRPGMLVVFTMLSVPGLFLMWRNQRNAFWVTLPWLAIYPLIYYFIQFMNRYRYPILWATFLSGSYLLTEVATELMGVRMHTKEVVVAASES
jgi:hypothetical protein